MFTDILCRELDVQKLNNQTEYIAIHNSKYRKMELRLDTYEKTHAVLTRKEEYVTICHFAGVLKLSVSIHTGSNALKSDSSRASFRSPKTNSKARGKHQGWNDCPVQVRRWGRYRPRTRGYEKKTTIYAMRLRN